MKVKSVNQQLLSIGLCLNLVLAGVALATEIKPLPIGATMPTWQNLPGIDGKSHDSATDLAQASAVIVIFYANHCPDCQFYRERIKKLQQDWQEKQVPVVLLNVDPGDEETLAAMQKHAQEKQLTGLYLKDNSQKVGRAFGAKLTPLTYVFDKEKKLVYRGAIDDHWRESDVKQRYVADAVAAVLAGKQVPVAETEAEGCDITYED